MCCSIGLGRVAVVLLSEKVNETFERYIVGALHGGLMWFLEDVVLSEVTAVDTSLKKAVLTGAMI